MKNSTLIKAYNFAAQIHKQESQRIEELKNTSKKEAEKAKTQSKLLLLSEKCISSLKPSLEELEDKLEVLKLEHVTEDKEGIVYDLIKDKEGNVQRVMKFTAQKTIELKKKTKELLKQEAELIKPVKMIDFEFLPEDVKEMIEEGDEEDLEVVNVIIKR